MPKKAREITVRLHDHQLTKLDTIARHPDWNRSRALRKALTLGLPLFEVRSPDLFAPPSLEPAPATPPAPPKRAHKTAPRPRAKTATTPRKQQRK